MTHRVSITIPCFNRLDYIKRCVYSIREKTQFDHEIVCVDDGSSTDVVSWLQDATKRALIDKLVLHPKNLGVAQSVADGWKASEGSHLMKLDSDVIVLEGDWLDRLVGTVEAIQEIGLLGIPIAPIYDSKTWMSREDFRVRLIANTNVNGAAFIMRRAVFDQLGYPYVFPSPYSFFDAEYSHRSQAAGFRVGYTPEQPRLAMTIDENRDNAYDKWKKLCRKENRPHWEKRFREIKSKRNLYVTHYQDQNS